ncbi:hypothetical protein T439DRAFT_376053 [Meredithblackwellia eburnea MCA 4105]
MTLSVPAEISSTFIEYHSRIDSRDIQPAVTFTPSLLARGQKARRGDSKKYVFAHVVQGDFQNYQAQDWADDIKLAKAAGIDAFALNVGNNADTDPNEMKLAFAAAEADKTFKLFYSFDMNYFNAAGSSDIILNTYLIPHAGSTAYFKYEGKSFVSTFSGEVDGTFLDGKGPLDTTVQSRQALFAKAKAASPSIDPGPGSAPDFADDASPRNDPTTDLDAAKKFGQGVMGWNAWPRTNGNMTMDVDKAYVASGLPYVGTVTRYEALISMSPGPAFIEVRNIIRSCIGGPAVFELHADYSHYLGPTRPNAGLPSLSTQYSSSQFDHTPMLTLSSYYNSWFKTGAAPTIKSETVVWWYRPHPKAVKATSDSLQAPTNAEWVDDNLYAAALIPAGSKAKSIVFTTGGKATNPISVTAGVNLVKAPFAAGKQSIALVDSTGANLLRGDGSDRLQFYPTELKFTIPHQMPVVRPVSVHRDFEWRDNDSGRELRPRFRFRVRLCIYSRELFLWIILPRLERERLGVVKHTRFRPTDGH